MTDGAKAMQLFDLRGHVVIITGGAVGIGQVYSDSLCAAGARVIIADIAVEAGQKLAARLNDEGGEALFVETDISNEIAVGRLADRSIDRFGRIDGLINNASLMSSLPRRSWLEIPVEEWDRVMSVDLRGLFLCCRAAAPHMKRQGRGKIVNIASTRVFEGTPNRLHYTTAKSGVVGFTRALARELGADNIAVNVVAPGLTLSDTQIATSKSGYLSSGYDEQRAFARAQHPKDLVGAVMFLLSAASDFMTGQTLVVDGGRFMR
ncbi:MAG TPA: SDR family oxidoreductase [Beijerinckiaceae bacterium]|nr:SDR family oxidoreductase [Beijerinckiaceae bacterium]